MVRDLHRSRCRIVMAAAVAVACFTGSTEAQWQWQKKTTLHGDLAQIAQSAIAVNPRNPNTIYAAGDSFAISRDRGEHWQHLPLPPGVLAISTITVHPADTNLILIGGYATGVHRTTDSGLSWQEVLPRVDFNGRSIVVDPIHPDTLHLGSLGQGFYSSHDRGQTWFLASSEIGSFCCLALRPDRSNVLLGGTYTNATISKSDDHGKTWRAVTKREAAEIPVIVFDRNAPGNVYASVWGTRSDHGVVHSTDGGENWSPLGFAGTEIWALEVSPADPNLLVAGGFGFSMGRTYLSHDRGRSWCAIERGLPRDMFVWMIAISAANEVFLAGTPQATNQGGVYKLAPGDFPPDPPQALAARETGSGTTALLAWQPPATCSAPIVNYRVRYGRSSGTVTDSVEAGSATQILLTHLQEGVTHFIQVLAIDNAGRRSLPSAEIRFTPNRIPAAPQGLAARHGLFQAKLAWQRNTDLDLAGYNLYRSRQPHAGFTKLNTALIGDTAYVDADLPAGRFYYVLTAVDTTGFESALTAPLAYRPLTLARGLLLVDETRDGTGIPASPSDAQVDDFYRRLLARFEFAEYDVRSAGLPDDTLGAYRMLLWHHDDTTPTTLPGLQKFLADYLAAGGRLLFSGWNLMASFTGNASPKGFAAGDFAFDYLQIDTTWKATEVQFTGVRGAAAGYQAVGVDAQRVPVPSWNGLLRDVHVFRPRPGARTLFRYLAQDSAYAFHDYPAGMVSTQHHVAVLGFPLYFMVESEAGAAMHTLLTQEFGLTPTGVENGFANDGFPQSYALSPNYPNPFAAFTRLQFILPQAATVEIEIFNVLGENVARLADGHFEAGRHELALTRALGRNGVYFCRMTVKQREAVVHRQTRKLVVIN